LVFFVSVGSGEVKEELVGRGLGEEVVRVVEALDLIELQFDEIVDGFDVGLEGVGPRGDGGVALAGDGLDGLGVRARRFGGDGTDVFGAVIGLSGGVG
jgi:hypothetical protein